MKTKWPPPVQKEGQEELDASKYRHRVTQN
jgi:hypothetical protein